LALYKLFAKKSERFSEQNFHAGEILRPREIPAPQGTNLGKGRKIYATIYWI